jgi:hypothetical protein
VAGPNRGEVWLTDLRRDAGQDALEPCTIEFRGTVMTTLLQQAFSEASKLPTAEQDLLASWLLAEVATENDFDAAIARSSSKLVALAREALAEHGAGLTEELDPERL